MTMNDPGWVRWSQWTEQGMIDRGVLRKSEMQEQLQRLEAKAREVLAKTDSDHVLYGRKLYDEAGELEELRFYLFPMSDEAFDKCVEGLHGQQVYAVHKIK